MPSVAEDIVRHELGLSKTEQRFPTEATCLAIYSRAVTSTSVSPACWRRRCAEPYTQA
ncbi:MAG TPA: hypothetical protein VM689_26150 [Aliidongia sp.]|nr:hypothetical protein [Aliidongia sp.]